MLNLSERAYGTFPLSIATSLALEGSVGVHPDRPLNNTILEDYPELWVNVRTLFRNYFNSITKDFYFNFSSFKHKEEFIREIEYLVSTVEQLSRNKTKVVLYHSQYNNVQKLFKSPIMRENTTDNQIKYQKALNEIISYYLTVDDKVVKTEILLEKIDKKCLMLTHFPLDLFVKSHSGLHLLESHTGVIKAKQMWYTKYYNGKNLSQIPFRLDFLSIFGDNEMFKPNLMPYRKALIELSQKYNWSHVTTRDKIIYGIDSLKDKFLAVMLKEMIRNR